MADELGAAFAALKTVLAKYAKKLQVTTDSETGYVLETKSPSPFPQHKGRPLYFAGVKTGKAYVSLHLLPLYMNPKLSGSVPLGLQKRMQGEACFNFKKPPEKETVAELKELVKVCLADWKERGWL